MAGRWVDVGVAARELGISTDAVRKRIARGSLRSEKRDSGVRVWLDDGGAEAGREGQMNEGGMLVEVLREQVTHLRSELAEERESRRRADMIIAHLTQSNTAFGERLRELEVPAGSRKPAEDPTSAVTVDDTATEHTHTHGETHGKESPARPPSSGSSMFGGSGRLATLWIIIGACLMFILVAVVSFLVTTLLRASGIGL